MGGYRLLEELGRGAMGVVYLAQQEALGGRPVALKLLAGSPVVSASDRRRFRTEAEALARVRHPNVVEVFDVVQAEGVDAFAMAWVRGGTLAELLERRRLWLTQREGSTRGESSGHDDLARLPVRRWVPFVCGLGVQLARALQAVHDAGLTHRDVKPGNVPLRADGTPLLSRFFFVAFRANVIVGAAAVDPLQAKGLIPVLRRSLFSEPGTFGFFRQTSLFGRGVSGTSAIDLDISGNTLEEVADTAQSA